MPFKHFKPMSVREDGCSSRDFTITMRYRFTQCLAVNGILRYVVRGCPKIPVETPEGARQVPLLLTAVTILYVLEDVRS